MTKTKLPTSTPARPPVGVGQLPTLSGVEGSKGRGGFFSYNYQPLLDLFNTDSIDLKNKKDFIPFGDDNLLPQQIVQLSRSVAVHRAILNSKAFFIAGNGFASENSVLKQRIENVNNFRESLRDVFYKLIFDELNTGNAYFEIITDQNKSYILLYHIDSSKVRLSAENKEIIIYPDWSQYKGLEDEYRTTIPLYPYFEKGKDGQYHSAIHIKQYEPEFSNYGLPTWYAGIDSVIIAGLTDVWNRKRLENQFSASGMLIIPGVNSDEDALQLDAEFDKYKGFEGEKAHEIIIQYLSDLGPGQARENAQFIKFPKDEEGNWSMLHQQAHTHLLSIHNWFKSLASFFGEKTGFDTQRILNEYEVALKTTIKTNQARYISIFQKLLSEFNLKTDDLTITNESPVYRINPIKYIWELRRESGLDYDPKDPNQQMYYAQLKNTFTTEKSNQPNTNNSNHEPKQ